MDVCCRGAHGWRLRCAFLKASARLTKCTPSLQLSQAIFQKLTRSVRLHWDRPMGRRVRCAQTSVNQVIQQSDGQFPVSALPLGTEMYFGVGVTPPEGLVPDVAQVSAAAAGTEKNRACSIPRLRSGWRGSSLGPPHCARELVRTHFKWSLCPLLSDKSGQRNCIRSEHAVQTCELSPMPFPSRRKHFALELELPEAFKNRLTSAPRRDPRGGREAESVPSLTFSWGWAGHDGRQFAVPAFLFIDLSPGLLGLVSRRSWMFLPRALSPKVARIDAAAAMSGRSGAHSSQRPRPASRGGPSEPPAEVCSGAGALLRLHSQSPVLGSPEGVTSVPF